MTTTNDDDDEKRIAKLDKCIAKLEDDLKKAAKKPRAREPKAREIQNIFFECTTKKRDRFMLYRNWILEGRPTPQK
jgi:hypothetical protein